MTSPISLFGGAATAAAGTATPKAGATAGQLDQNAFLKLLVAQLQYQDPSHPADSTQMMAQTAQYAQVQKLQEMAAGQSRLLAVQLASSAGAMVGRTIAYATATGASATGVVTAATLTGTEPTLRVGTTEVPLSTVTAVLGGAG